MPIRAIAAFDFLVYEIKIYQLLYLAQWVIFADSLVYIEIGVKQARLQALLFAHHDMISPWLVTFRQKNYITISLSLGGIWATARRDL